MGVQTYEWPSLCGQEELQGAGGHTLGPLVGRQFCSWGFGPLMVSLPLHPQSSITAGSLVPFERGNPHRGPGISFIPRKTRQTPREANKPIERPAHSGSWGITGSHLARRERLELLGGYRASQLYSPLRQAVSKD